MAVAEILTPLLLIAVQCVVQALKLLRGDSAVLPVLRNAAAQYDAQQTAPIEEISALLSQVTLQAQQQVGLQLLGG